jgi:tRNA A37 N6-isopentenylltransferase MiaA
MPEDKMAILLDWLDDEHRILCYIFEGRWTWEEFQTVSRRAIAMIQSVPHHLNSIADFSRSASLPPQDFVNVRNAMNQIPPNLDLVLLVGGSLLAEGLIKAFSQVYHSIGSHFVVTRTLVDAILMIQDRTEATV